MAVSIAISACSRQTVATAPGATDHCRSAASCVACRADMSGGRPRCIERNEFISQGTWRELKKVCKCFSMLADDANPIKLCGMKHDRGLTFQASSNFLLCSTLETDSRTKAISVSFCLVEKHTEQRRHSWSLSGTCFVGLVKQRGRERRLLTVCRCIYWSQVAGTWWS